MQLLNVVALVLAAVAAAGVVVLLARRKQGDDGTALETRLRELADRLDGRFSDASRERSEVLLKHSERVGQLERDISERMAQLYESQKQSLAIADELRGLQRILKNPGQRGALGEVFLETSLRNVLPPELYQMQYSFPGNALRADAVIRYDSKLIPVDAKFSLDNYNRYVEAQTDAERDQFAKAVYQDLKKRIDETAKYVRPEDGTFEFAMMFIPSEALYYDLIVNQVGSIGRERSMIEYAHEKRVVPVSPMVLYAYLQTVLHGMQQIQFTQGLDEIRKNVGQLAGHLKAYGEYQRRLGQNIKASFTSYNAAMLEYNKIDKDVVRIAGSDAKILPKTVEDEE